MKKEISFYFYEDVFDAFAKSIRGLHDTQHNNIKNNDTQHYGTQNNNRILSVTVKSVKNYQLSVPI